MNELLLLFMTFAKIGLFTFGGGYAMIALIERECEKQNWIDHEEMMDLVVIAESTPGPIAINCATYVGYKQRKMSGAIVATLGIVLPAFLIIYLISLVFTKFLDIQIIQYAMQGIKIAVCYMIFDAGINMVKKMKKNKKPRTIMVISMTIMLLILIMKLPISSIYLMLFFGLISLLMDTKGGRKA